MNNHLDLNDLAARKQRRYSDAQQILQSEPTVRCCAEGCRNEATPPALRCTSCLTAIPSEAIAAARLRELAYLAYDVRPLPGKREAPVYPLAIQGDDTLPVRWGWRSRVLFLLFFAAGTAAVTRLLVWWADQ